MEPYNRFFEGYTPRSTSPLRAVGVANAPGMVLIWVMGMRFHRKDFERAFFSERSSHVLGGLVYATPMR
jgi:hypothetical protein